MKKVELTPASAEIDWSKPQWVQNVVYKSMIVLTTGGQTAITFQGTCMPCNEYHVGQYGTWVKSEFRRLEGSIPFTISNED